MDQATDLVLAILPGLVPTLLITLTALSGGAVVGLLLVVLKRSPHKSIRVAITFLVDFIRGVPTLVWLIVIFYGLPSDLKLTSFAAACLGIGLIASAYMCENYLGALAAVEEGQHEAGTALGLSRRQVAVRIIYPQALVSAIPPSATFAISLIKESAVASIIGAEEVLYLATREITAGESALLVLLITGSMYIVAGLPLAGFSRWSDSRLRKRIAP